MVRRWIERFGIEGATALLEANNEPAPMSVRVDLARVSLEEAQALLESDGVLTRPSDLGGGFLRVVEGAPQRTATFQRGLIYIQDEASGLIPSLLAAEPGWTVLDACSAPGGKALALARAVGRGGPAARKQGRAGSTGGGRGIVVAGDRHPSRLRLVAANTKRMRIGNLRLVAGDFTVPPFGAVFDAALVDAPCSGSGVFRRDVESRYRLSPEDLAPLAANQRAILDGVASVVKPGGRLVYSVCSIEPEEGPGIVESFLASRNDWSKLDIGLDQAHLARFVAPDGTLRTLPHRDGLDGFYAATMRRR
jgi:16S rRNA (cytosine967-C5)-methyltransferase